jgi:TonB-linked SusC/RagA family outer membrane protein
MATKQTFFVKTKINLFNMNKNCRYFVKKIVNRAAGNIILLLFMLFFCVGLSAQNNIKGRVTDAAGEPVVGASIVEKGSANGVLSGSNGEYSISVKADATLQVSCIGYSATEQTVGLRTVVDFTLVEEAQQLDDLVVTALGIRRSEKALGYAVQRVSGDDLTIAKGANVVTSLTGKVAGLSVTNSTEFMGGSGITLRGYGPLIVVDGVMFGNIALDDIPADDIESLDVLKGPTAAALYGSRGSNGVIMVTTKKAKEQGIKVAFNSSTMFHAGYTKFPEVQTSYSSGGGGKYLPGAADYVWGDRLDIGRTGLQYNPYTYEWEEAPLTSKGKNNFRNFLEQAVVTNNNISLSQKGKYGSIRASLNHIYNKGQYPNQNSQNFSFSVGGTMDYKRFHLDAGINYHKFFYTSNLGAGYGQGNFMYNMVIWTGPEYDIREYREYWKKGKENQEQNWFVTEWYDNPYFLAYEKTSGGNHDKTNSYLKLTLDLTDWLKAVLQLGADSYGNRSHAQTSQGATTDKNGYYGMSTNLNFSTNNEFRLMFDKKFGDFNFDGFLGGSMYYYDAESLYAQTPVGSGISMPGYYSLYASVEKPDVGHGQGKDATSSAYGRFGAAWKSAVFVEVTGRNDWVSTLAKSERSYFYPSFSGSVILSELLPFVPKQVMNFWKIRGSWTQTKHPAGRYEINQTYSTPNLSYWGDNAAIYLPSTIRDYTLRPSATVSFELGTEFHFFNSRLKLDVAYYNRINYDLQRYGAMSSASGYTSTLINYDEEHLSRGVEFTISGDVVKNSNFSWHSSFNWAADRYYYYKVDPVYSTKRPWVAEGKDWYWVEGWDFEQDPQGNLINYNGQPRISNYPTLFGSSNPDWIWGWSNRLHYKNLHFAFSFDGRHGGLAFNTIERYLLNSGRSIDTDTPWRYAEVVEGEASPYLGEGVKIVPGIDGKLGTVKYDEFGVILEDTRKFAPNDVYVSYENYTRNVSDNTIGARRYYHEKTFFKLRELSIGYSVPAKYCRYFGMTGAELSLVGQNLLLWTKDFRFSDPDVDYESINSPSIRLIGFNLTFNF